MTGGMVPYECLMSGYLCDPKVGDPKAGIPGGVEFNALSGYGSSRESDPGERTDQ